MSVRVAFPRRPSPTTKPGVWTGLGTAQATAQVQQLHSSASGTATNLQQSLQTRLKCTETMKTFTSAVIISFFYYCKHTIDTIGHS